MDAVLVMSEADAQRLFPEHVLENLPAEVNILGRVDSFDPSAHGPLPQADAVFTAWSAPLLTLENFTALPRLKFLFHLGGTVKPYVEASCWEAGLRVTTAADANAVPVAEYTLAMILLANKQVFALNRSYGAEEPLRDHPLVGNYRKRIGIIGASRIGRLVVGLLKPFELEILLSDPFISEAGAAELGVQKVELSHLMEVADVVSLHAPSLPGTRGMITAELLACMKPGATFINTARGELVDQAALVRELQSGRISAILDVTTPWVLPEDSPLRHLPNVFLTPHIAGSLGTELERMTSSALGQARAAARGASLTHEVSAAHLALMA